MMRTRPRVAVAAAVTLAVGAIAWSDRACAYRPFDGTDAAVADPDELEIELQPAGAQRAGGETTLIGPVGVVNYGFAKDWELVLQGQLETPLSSGDPSSLTDTGVFLKHVVRPGVLQDQAGPSVATEFGVLLPGVNADAGYGASWAGIVSQRWQWGTVHFNLQTELTRDHNADVFVDTILEGPSTWTVRPVAEVFYENEFGQAQTFSGLVGAIWQVNDKLALDVAFRHALVDGRPLSEVRAGVTFGFPLHFGGNPR